MPIAVYVVLVGARLVTAVCIATLLFRQCLDIERARAEKKSAQKMRAKRS